MAFQHEQAFSHERDSVKAQQKLVDEIVFAADRFDLGHDPWGVETLIRGAGKNEALECLEIDSVRRHACVYDARASRGFAHRTGMTNRAIQKDPIEPLSIAARDTDRQIFARFVEET